MFRLALPLIALGLLVSCTSTPAEKKPRGIAKYAEDARLGPETGRICFASTIDGFSMNERDTVLLHDGRKRYMVEVAGGCFDLDFAQSIALDSALNCLTPGDFIIIADVPGGTLGSRRCMIREIRNWNADAQKPAADPA